jgi:hypothetical protein
LFWFFAAEMPEEGFTIDIYDGSQRMVYQKNVPGGLPKGTAWPVDLTKGAPGIYFYKVYSGALQKFGKLIIQ